MGLKQSVVVVSEFTVKTASGKGTRGATPGDYVKRYMARKAACEPIDLYVSGYMARDNATEQSVSGTSRKDNVAFSESSIALSHKQLNRKSKQIQNAFESGKTVIKTVLSFETEYLKEHGVLPPDFVMKGRGSARGHLDQQKLRMAIMKGINALGFDSMCCVGVIQVDTAHVHCHLAMCDLGRGRVMKNGQQKGTLSERDKRAIRMAVDRSLGGNEKSICACTEYESAEKLAIKATLMHAFSEKGFTQAFIAALPENRNVWRANTNRRDMRLANTLLYEFTKDVLSETDAYEKADSYAKTISQDAKEYEKIKDSYRDRVTKRSMNAVYTKLKRMDLDLIPATPYIEGAVTGEGCMLSRNLRRYQKNRKEHRDKAKEWNAIAAGTEDERLKELAESERQYHLQCMIKYALLLPRITPMPQKMSLMRAQNLYHSTCQMEKDPEFFGLTPEESEKLGMERYGVANGGLLGTDDFKSLKAYLKRDMDLEETNYMTDCMYAGYDMQGNILKADFNILRAIDLCDVEFEPTKEEKETYKSMTDMRRRLADAAGMVVPDIERACDYSGRVVIKDTGKTSREKKQRQGKKDRPAEKRKPRVMMTPFHTSLEDTFTKTIMENSAKQQLE